MKAGPLSLQFVEKLKRLIASETYKVGTPLPSIERLHVQHGLSKNTVTTALKILREEGIIQRGKASRNGYMVVKKPKDISESARAIENSIVKINMPFSVWNSVGHQLLETLESVFTTHNLRLIFSNNNNSIQEETRFLQTVLARDEQIASTLILMTGNSFHNPNIKLLNHLQARLPVILLDRYIPNMLCHYVGTDNHEIGFLSVQHLLKKGHTQIGFVSHSMHLSPPNDRFSGYLTALIQADIDPNPAHSIRKSTDHVDLDYIKALGQELGQDILSLSDKPTAWVCSSDKEAVGLIDFFQKQGYTIPDDIAFIGCDNDQFLLHDKEYTLTTFEYPYIELAKEIYHITEALTTNPSFPYKKVEFPATFIEGETA